MAEELRTSRPELAEALELAEEALRREPADAEALRARARAFFRLARFDDAAESAQRLTELRPRDAGAWNLLGRIQLWRVPPVQADVAFRRAAELAPRFYAVPYRVGAEEFDRVAADAVASVPPELEQAMENVLVVARRLPLRRQVVEGLEPDLLGLYHGPTVRQGSYTQPLAEVTLYQWNIESTCADAGSLRSQIWRVVLHEIGHHFAMDHDELDSAGL